MCKRLQGSRKSVCRRRKGHCARHKVNCGVLIWGGGKSSVVVEDDLSPTLTTTHYGEPVICYEVSKVKSTYRKQGHPRTAFEGQGWEETGVSDTLNVYDNSEARTQNHPNGSRAKITGNVVQALSGRMGTGGNNTPMVMEDDMDNQYVVRRLTPMECERLQGYPDNWTNIGEWVDSKGKKHKDADSPRYKALGNSIALPFWQYLADKMCNQLRSDGVEEPTMASLFSGICGFELVFARAGAKPIWNSEIEEFPEAVSRVHFGDDDTGSEGDYKQYL